MLLVTGGWNQDNENLDSTEIYQEGQRQWREVGTLPAGIMRIRGATVDNTVFMTGELLGERFLSLFLGF